MTKVIRLRSRYIAIPVWNVKEGDEDIEERLSIIKDGKTIYEFLMPMGDDLIKSGKQPDFYHYLQMTGVSKKLFYPDFMTKADDNLKTGDEIMISGDFPERFFDLILEEDEEPDYEDCLLHYHSPHGFINDPNGLIYDDGIYHIFHQHNPMSINWGNMSWGHAVTTDFIHYSFVSDALVPDELGVMFSGCAIKNDKGCFSLPKEALLFFYTCAGNVPYKGKKEEPVNYRRGKSVQRMAYSLDGGRTVIKYPGFELDGFSTEDRDPKVFYYRESGVYIMTLYLTGNRFAILRSENLQDWEKTQELDLVPMWECPDLVEISDESGNRRWALMSADGYYYIGKFDGYKFKSEGVMRGLYDSKLPYAAQSFSNIKGRVVVLAWLRSPNCKKNFTGYLSVPRELSLDKDEYGYYIRQSFAEEVMNFVQEEDGYSVIRDINITEKIDPSGMRLDVVFNDR